MGEYQDSPSKIFCLTVPKLSVGESFTVALISGSEKVSIGGWEYHDFPLKFFCLTVPRISVGESFTVALIFASEKVWIGGGGGASRFSVEKFLSHSAENFRRGIFHCCINFGYRKSLEKRGGEYQDFPSKIFCLKVPNISVGESFTVAIFSGTEEVWIRGGSIKLFRRKSFAHSPEKVRRWIF